MAAFAYALATMTALACALLLTRGYRRSRFRLLLWSGLCFWGFFLGHLLIYCDTVLFPHIDLYVARISVWFISMLLLMFGLVWESGR